MAARAEPSNGLCPNAAAKMQHPSDHTSEAAVMVANEGTSNSSGALYIDRTQYVAVVAVCTHLYWAVQVWAHIS